jgi:hypothetical protein
MKRAEAAAARRNHSKTTISSRRRDAGPVDGPLLTQSASLKDLVQRGSTDPTEEEGVSSPKGDRVSRGGTTRSTAKR